MMRAFAELLAKIEQTNSTNEKVDLMSTFFRATDAETAAWALYFLSGQRPKKFIPSGKLREWAEEIANLPPWLAEDCYSAVGDTAEMIALIVAPFRIEGPGADAAGEVPLADWVEKRIQPLRDASEEEQKERVQSWWRTLTPRESFVVNKLMTGALRIGVSETLVYRAIAEAYSLPRPTVASRLLGKWAPSGEFFKRLTRPVAADDVTAAEDREAEEALPVPFCLAASVGQSPEELGRIDDWQIEWKWDGIRAEIVKLGPKVELWSRGEERVTESFPDLVEVFSKISGDYTVDGEILAGIASSPGSFNDLQKRLNRKRPSPSLVRGNPVCFLAYDLLRAGGETLLDRPLRERRKQLEERMAPETNAKLGLSASLECGDWEGARRAHSQSRSRRAEGLMLKRKNAPYAAGRKRGIWYKWKVDPLTLDVVLTAAQPGTGRRASLYTDYTFSIRKGDAFVPIAKAYSGLSDDEISELDQWIRRNTLERHGPVRTLKPSRVFEIGFEGIGPSSRHKSGYAVRFPRILRERTDKPPADSDSMETVERLFQSLSRSETKGDPEPESAQRELFPVGTAIREERPGL